MSPAPITRIYRSCNPVEAISPEDPRWVDLDEARGEFSAVRQLCRSLRMADPQASDVRFLAGHIGVGKTSALRQLAGELRRAGGGESAFLVIEGNVGDALDTNDLDFTDLLVFIADRVMSALRFGRVPGFDPSTTFLRNVWDSIVGFLKSDVQFSGDLDTPWGGLAMELRNRPGSRARLREAVERHQSALIYALNDLLDAARVAVLQMGKAGMVLLIDGLDRLSRLPISGDSPVNPQERLFIDRAEQLASLRVMAVYTVPISLVYTPRFTQAQLRLAEFPPLLSMVALHNYGETATANHPGMHALEQIIAARCRHAQVAFDDLFDSVQTRQHLCSMSGGHPRHLMMLIQSACDAADTLPLTRTHVDRAVRNYTNSLLRSIPDEAWPRLKAFDNAQRDLPKDELHLNALFSAWVFEYMNGQPWYEINPVLRTLDRYATA